MNPTMTSAAREEGGYSADCNVRVCMCSWYLLCVWVQNSVRSGAGQNPAVYSFHGNDVTVGRLCENEIVFSLI